MILFSKLQPHNYQKNNNMPFCFVRLSASARVFTRQLNEVDKSRILTADRV